MKAASLPAIVISGSGVWTPAEVITNEELVASYNAYAQRFNAEHAEDIAAGRIEDAHIGPAVRVEVTGNGQSAVETKREVGRGRRAGAQLPARR